MRQLHSFGLSDIGVSRPNNEDVFAALREIGFFAIADGMGGHQAGEVAARIAVDHLCSSIHRAKIQDPLDWIQCLRYAIEEANQQVFQLGNTADHLRGMGTTICCLLWSGSHVFYAHVGDSRLYRFRDQKLQPLTQDHSLMAEWLKFGKTSSTPFPYKNVITRAIGTAPQANPEIAYAEAHPDDLFLLCTDGLSDVLTPDDIEIILNSAPNLEIAAGLLIETAKIKGSCDNITLLLIQEADAKDLSRQQLYDPAGAPGSTSDAARTHGPASEPL